MRIAHSLLLASLFGFCFVASPGCGSGEAEVAPRTESEIEAYKQEVYAAEEEDDVAAAESEDE